jgi:hypothetical protein
MIVDKYRNLGRMFTDLASFTAVVREAYSDYDYPVENNSFNEAFLDSQLTAITIELKEFIKAVIKKASFPPFDTAIPLLYVAHYNLQRLVISSSYLLQDLLKLEPIAYEVAGEEVQQYLLLHADETIEEKEFRTLQAKAVEQAKSSLGFQHDVLVPLLKRVIDVFKEELVNFDHFYNPILGGLESDVVDGKDAAVRISNTFLDITHDKDLYTFIDITKKGILTESKAYTKVPKSEISPEVLGILFYYLREVGVVTNTNASQVARLISLITGVSHNTIRPELNHAMPKDRSSSSLIDGKTSSAYANEAKKLLTNMIELLNRDVNHNLQKL